MKKALFFTLQISLCTLGCFYTSSAQAQVTSDGTINTQLVVDSRNLQRQQN